MAERIVSIGLLTKSDLALLGKGFHRHYPVEDDGAFADILAKLKAMEGTTSGSLSQDGEIDLAPTRHDID